ncbi:MAG: hypothetical protein BZY80_03475 [SAR202 cluster bacterium Io17-Chloro-G2]|nr:MAG: hypothetical protein BZY80_03475 [SAR202 cluster bacterium Io17-Chloro-G2]
MGKRVEVGKSGVVGAGSVEGLTVIDGVSGAGNPVAVDPQAITANETAVNKPKTMAASQLGMPAI